MIEKRPISAWEIWANPILKRYCRSRLRKKHLIPWMLLVLILTLFIVFLLFTISQRMESQTWEEAARIALIPLVIVQMFLLMFLGTGAVASGIARESIDGMIDYQRLTPMTPMAKIVGYLFGLPVREYVLTLVTMPFVGFCAVGGRVPLEPALKFYSVFFSSVVLYHLTGLVAGSVVKRKFLAGRTAQFFVALLYLVLPRFAALGFVFFVYLTVLPAWSEQALLFMSPSGPGQALEVLSRDVPWFRWDFPPTVFSLLIQGALIVVFFVILSRKWRDPQCHVLGHGFAVVVFAGFLALLLGNALPLIEDGSFFRSSSMFVGGLPRGVGGQAYGWLTMIVMGLAVFFTMLLLLCLIVPNRHEAMRGFRRAAKHGRRRVTWNSGDNTSLLFAVSLMLMGACGWVWLSRTVLATPQFAGVNSGMGLDLAQGMALVLPLLVVFFVLEWRGWRPALLLGLLLWVVPPLVAVIFGASGQLEVVAVYMASVSGPVLPIYAVLQQILAEHPPLHANAVREVGTAFWFSVGLYALALPYVIKRWWGFRRDLKDKARLQQEEEGTLSSDN